MKQMIVENHKGGINTVVVKKKEWCSASQRIETVVHTYLNVAMGHAIACKQI
jgi:hypothetical protein